MRGREPLVTCESCGRKSPRNKAVVFEKAISFGTEPGMGNSVRYFSKRKVYYCISCAKHRGIFEKKKENAIRNSLREKD